MPAVQIYQVVNTIANNLSYTGAAVVDPASFTAFATATLSGNKEGVYNQMYDLIAKTMFAIDVAEEDERGIIVDAWEYGCILRKISYVNQAAEAASDWDIQNPVNPYSIQPKSGIVQEFFECNIPAFEWNDVHYGKQLTEAFRDPQSLAGFIDGLFQRMRNAYSISKNGLSDAAVGALVGTIYANSTNVNYSRRVRHLLTEYNSITGGSLTSADSYLDQGYLDYVRKCIVVDKKRINKLTRLYNTGTVERRTTDDDAFLDLSISITASYAKFWGDTYNENYVMLPKHNEIVNWGIATDPDKVVTSLDGGTTTTTIDNIIGILRDKDALVATMDRSRFVNMYDQWNDRNVFKLEAERRYICDPSENAIVYLND